MLMKFSMLAKMYDFMMSVIVPNINARYEERLFKKQCEISIET
jgi:hypothetical protein